LIFSGQESFASKTPSLFDFDPIQWGSYPQSEFLTKVISLKKRVKGTFTIMKSNPIVAVYYDKNSGDGILGIFNEKFIEKKEVKKEIVGNTATTTKATTLRTSTMTTMTTTTLTAPTTAPTKSTAPTTIPASTTSIPTSPTSIPTPTDTAPTEESPEAEETEIQVQPVQQKSKKGNAPKTYQVSVPLPRGWYKNIISDASIQVQKNNVISNLTESVVIIPFQCPGLHIHPIDSPMF